MNLTKKQNMKLKLENLTTVIIELLLIDYSLIHEVYAVSTDS